MNRAHFAARRVPSRLVAVVAAIGLALAGAASIAVPGAAAAGSNPVQSENQQPGTDQWRITLTPSDDTANQIKGYASDTSVNLGDTITMFVTVNPVQSYAIDIYRIGYYQGLGGRLMQHVGPLAGVAQPACPVDPQTGMVSCSWAPSYQLSVPTTWVSGIYLAKLTNANGYQNYITFTVRDDASHSALEFQQSVTTYEAYNNYPNDVPSNGTKPLTGKSLYEYNSSTSPTGLGTTRAVRVSFDRPYSNDDGAGDFLDWELYFVRWIEQNGYDVSYATDVDTHRAGAQLLNHLGFLSVGHDEYWTKEMVDNVTAARDADVGLGFFGANAMYWQIRLDASSSGVANRVITCYKSAALDPVQGATTTVQFRSPPANRPEQQIIGQMSTGQQPNGALPATYVVNNSSNWVYAGAGVNDGDSIPRIVGYETDRVVPSSTMPTAVPGTYVQLSHSPYTASDGSTDYAQSTVYQAASGAWVFAAGSIEWSWGLYNYNRATYADVRIQQITANVLNRFSAGVPVPPPAAPSNLSATPASDGSIGVSWTDNSTTETHFVLQQATSADFADAVNIPIAAGITSYSATGLAGGVYYFRVQAVDSGGGSPYSPLAAASTVSYRSTVLGIPSLTSYWRLGEAQGLTAVDMKSGANGAYQGAVGLGAPGTIANDPDTSATFDGSTAKVSLPAVAPTTDFSIEATSCLPSGWAGSNSTIYGTGNNIRLLARPGGTASATEVYVGLWLNGIEYNLQPKSGPSNAGACVLWDVTRSAGTMTVYRNGVQIGQRTDLPATATANISGWIGAQSGTTYYGVGRIDDVSIYGAALSAGQVQTDWIAASNGVTPPVITPPPPPSYRSVVLGEPTLASYWRLGESRGPTAVDAKSGANGTYLGATGFGAAGAITGDPDTSIAFDGATAKVSLPAVAPVTDFSIEASSCLPSGWAGANSTIYGTGNNVRLLARPGGTASATEVYVGVWLNGVEYTIQPKATIANSGACVLWDVTRSGATLTVYRNGALIGQRTDLPATATANISGWIGAQSGTTYYAVGRIDDVSLYTGALSAGQVQNHAAAVVGGTAP